MRDGLSPAQKLFGHPMQDTLPAHPRSFSQEWQQTKEETEHKVIATQQNTRNYYDKTAHPLSDIQQGSHVVLQNPRTKLWDTYGVVVSVDQHRKYHIKIKSGKVVIRNRRFLRRRVPALNSRTEPINTQESDTPSLPISPSTVPGPRRSSRARRRPQRLIEDPLWN